MRKTLWAVAIAVTCSGPALAVTAEGTSGNYATLLGAYEISDSARKADDGLGGQLTFGIPLSIPHGAIELSYYDVGRDRALDGNKDYQTSLLVNYVHDFGAFGWSQGGLSFKPFVLGGLGGVQEDVLGEKRTHLGADVGVGTLIGLPWYGLAVRTEARALGQSNDRSVAGQDYLIDYRIMLGLQVPLMLAGAVATAPEAPQAVEACELSVVDPVSGRKDCAADSDHDGVADGVDQCPASEPGAIVNAVGCPAVEAAAAVAPPPAAPVPIPEVQSVNFADNSFDIDDESKKKLDNVVVVLASDPAVRVEIEGRTDNRGSEAYNIVLGNQRAEAVRQYLIAKGADALRLSAISFGEFKPVATNKTEAGRHSNRLVQFRIIKN